MALLEFVLLVLTAAGALAVAVADDSEAVLAGNIIIRQRGTKFHPGRGVGIGKDHTIFATRDGFVRFWFNVPKGRQEVSVKPTREPQRASVSASA